MPTPVRKPCIVYGLYGGLLFANIFLLIIGLLSLRAALWLVNRPRPYVPAVVYVLIFSGAYSLNHSLFEPAVISVMGVAGIGDAARTHRKTAGPIAIFERRSSKV